MLSKSDLVGAYFVLHLFLPFLLSEYFRFGPYFERSGLDLSCLHLPLPCLLPEYFGFGALYERSCLGLF